VAEKQANKFDKKASDKAYYEANKEKLAAQQKAALLLRQPSPDITERKCLACDTVKSIDNFQKRSVKLNTYHAECKQCVSVRRKAEYAINPEPAKQRAKERAKLNPERKQAEDKKHYLDNRENRQVYQSTYYQANKETRIAYSVKYTRERAAADPLFRMVRNLRGRTNVAFKLRNVTKNGHTLDWLGCTPLELRAHLVSKFTPEMTLENYGSHWHIDHIIPVSAWDLTNPTHIAACFHWTNLQPLMGAENMSKGGTNNISADDYSDSILKHLASFA